MFFYRFSILLFLISCSVLAASGLTWFYMIYESLPKIVRTPASLILAPIAVIDGLCALIGIPGVYGKPEWVFLINWTGCLVLFGLVFLFASRKKIIAWIHKKPWQHFRSQGSGGTDQPGVGP